MSIAEDFIDVFYGHNDFTNFGAQLFRLIAKADTENLYSLAKGFPKEVALYAHWKQQKEMPPMAKIHEWCDYYMTITPGQAFK